MSILNLAKRNLKRKPFRSLALIISTSLVSSLLFITIISTKGVITSIDLAVHRLGADMMAVPEGYDEKAYNILIAGKPTVFYLPKGTLDKIRKIKGIKVASPQLFIRSLSHPCCAIADVMLIAFDPETDFTVTPWLKEAIKRNLEKNEVIIGSAINRSKRIKFYGKEFIVAGQLYRTGLDYIDTAVFMTLESAHEMIKESKEKAFESLLIEDDVFSAIFIQTDPKIHQERLAILLEHEIKGIRVITSEDIIRSVKRQLYVLIKIFSGMGIIFWIVTLVLIGTIFSLIVNERQREIGILRALGAKKHEIFLLIFAEAFTISLFGGISGILIGAMLLLILKNPIGIAFNLPYLWPNAPFIALSVLGVLILSLLTISFAVFYPALKISRMEPFQAIVRE